MAHKNENALVLALAGGASAAAAARQTGVSERTVRRRLAEKGFRARVDQMRASLVRQAVGKLSALGGRAAETLEKLFDDPSGAVRLGAARAVMDFMFKGDAADTQARMLAELRAEVEELKRTRHAASK